MPVDKFGNEIKQRGTVVKSDEGISLSFANKTYIRLDGERYYGEFKYGFA